MLIGAMLRILAEAIHRRILHDLNAAGYKGLSLPHIVVFRFPGLDTVASLSRAYHFPRAVQGFDGLDAVNKRLFQNALADGPERQAEQLSFDVLAVAYDIHINVGGAVEMTREGVGVAGGASPNIGVRRRKDDVSRIGPVVVQSLPDAARSFGDVGLRAALLMHLEVLVGAVAKKLRAVRPKVGEPGDVLLGCEGSCLVKMNRGHLLLLLW